MILILIASPILSDAVRFDDSHADNSYANMICWKTQLLDDIHLISKILMQDVISTNTEVVPSEIKLIWSFKLEKHILKVNFWLLLYFSNRSYHPVLIVLYRYSKEQGNVVDRWSRFHMVLLHQLALFEYIMVEIFFCLNVLLKDVEKCLISRTYRQPFRVFIPLLIRSCVQVWWHVFFPCLFYFFLGIFRCSVLHQSCQDHVFFLIWC
jgi:hypothetical protein